MAWRKELDKLAVGSWLAILQEAVDLRNAWQHAAAPVVTRRSQMETGRGTLRVILRAWREVVDDVRAGAAKWEGRWQTAQATPIPTRRQYVCGCGYATTARVAFWEHERTCTKTRTPTTTKQVNMGQLTLARRLRFSCNDSMWASEAGWRVRMVFAWQRLVRAGKIQQARQHSPMWRESERNRITALAEQHRLTLRSNEDWEDQSLQARGQRYAWDLEASIQAQQGVNNSAAAVMARRRQHSGSPGGTRPVVAGSSAQHAQTGRDKRPRSDISPQHATHWDGARPQGEPDISDDAAGDPARNASTAQRHAGDGLLVFNTLSLRRLEAQLRSQYYWRPDPFGDG